MESAVSETPLIHGLPDDIALLCLARVPRQRHNSLRCVSRRWKALLCSEEWHSYRKRNSLDESWIYVICRGTGYKCYVLAPDPATRTLKVIHVMEPPCSAREGISIETLDRRLFLMGGCSWLKDANDEVYCYDAFLNSWSRSAPMPTARCYFVSAALTLVLCRRTSATSCMFICEFFIILQNLGPTYIFTSVPQYKPFN